MKNVLTTIEILAAAAWADGELAEGEALAMELIISAAKLSEREQKQARGWLEKRVTLEEVDVHKLGPGERVEIYADACRLMTFDQSVDSAEHAFLVKLRKALAISEADAKAARERVNS